MKLKQKVNDKGDISFFLDNKKISEKNYEILLGGMEATPRKELQN